MFTDEYATKLLPKPEEIIENEDLFDTTGALPVVEKETVYQKDLDQ